MCVVRAQLDGRDISLRNQSSFRRVALHDCPSLRRVRETPPRPTHSWSSLIGPPRALNTPIKMTWNVRRSLLRTHVAGFLLLASLVVLFFIYCHLYLLVTPIVGRSRLRVKPLVDTETRVGADQPYHWLLNEPAKCAGSPPFLVLLITVEPRQLEARDAIRRSWGNENGFVRLFLLGQTPDAYPQSSLEEESQQYHDIIQQDFMDTYNNLTIKVLMGMSWVARFCPHARYVMKTDSDMFVNTEYLIQKLLKPNTTPRRNYFTGYLIRDNAPIRSRDSKWYMPPEIYPYERYPTFCSGTGYVFSGDVAGKIYTASLSIPHLHLEDVYVGICLAKLRIEPVPPPDQLLFNNWRVPYSSCRYSHLITSHQFQPSELVKYWNDLQSNKHNPCPKRGEGQKRAASVE